MTIRTRGEAIDTALAQQTNTPGFCQANVDKWFNAPAVGDVDHDGDADAVDGWESEPKAYRHPGDRNPPFGVPLSFRGGSHGFGHRALSLINNGRIRSTDMHNNSYSAGVTSTVTGPTTSAAIGILEQVMGVVYTGWSETISGQLIPGFEQQNRTDPKPQTRGFRVDRSLRRLRIAQAHAKPARAKLLGAAIKALLAIPTHDRKS